MDVEAVVPVEQIQQVIYELRGQRMMLDADLAVLYGVTTSRLNEQVKRNIRRFPADFMFQLTPEEVGSLRSQNAISTQSEHRSREATFAPGHGFLDLGRGHMGPGQRERPCGR